MPDTTSAARQRAFRARKADQQLAEVRGIFARPCDHEAIKQFARELESARAQDKKDRELGSSGQVLG